MTRRALVLAAILCLAAGLPVVLAPSAAWACSCAKLSTREYIERADVIFTGQASGREGGPGEIAWQFHVSRVYKGTAGLRLYVASQASGASCGYEFVIGRSYLVLARQAVDDRLVTSLCSGNNPLADEPVSSAFGPGRAPQHGAEQDMRFEPGVGGNAIVAVVVAGVSLAVVGILLGVAFLARRRS